jgi:hypothetical protein
VAGHAEKLGIPWREVRQDISVKGNIFEPFLSKYGGRGPDVLMKQGLARCDQILQRCPELQNLQERIIERLAHAR